MIATWSIQDVQPFLIPIPDPYGVTQLHCVMQQGIAAKPCDNPKKGRDRTLHVYHIKHDAPTFISMTAAKSLA